MKTNRFLFIINRWQLLALLFLLSCLTNCYAQLNDDSIRTLVLCRAKTGKEYVFKHSNETTTYLKYLGAIKTKKGISFKVLNSVWIWGLSHRATNRLLIYNNCNQYIGQYAVTIISDLPDFIKNDQLIFINSEDNCDPKLITRVDLSRGLPKHFFLKCKGNTGDIYTFSNE